jgi:hypothetical protein
VWWCCCCCKKDEEEEEGMKVERREGLNTGSFTLRRVHVDCPRFSQGVGSKAVSD